MLHEFRELFFQNRDPLQLIVEPGDITAEPPQFNAAAEFLERRVKRLRRIGIAAKFQFRSQLEQPIRFVEFPFGDRFRGRIDAFGILAGTEEAKDLSRVSSLQGT